MNTVKKILPYILVVLVAFSAFMFVQLFNANKDYAENTLLIERAQEDDAEIEPVSISLSFENKSVKHTNNEIETFDFMMSNRSEYIWEDIHFVTVYEDWTEDHLKAAAEELSKNIHGDEMRYLKAVSFEAGNGLTFNSHYDSEVVNYEIPISMYNFLSNDSKFNYTIEQGFISITGINEKCKIEEYARPISKAYGYHFAHFVLGLNGTDEDKETEYYKLRAQDDERIRTEIAENEDYLNSYIWYLYDIAANDYVYFMGSENAQRILDFGFTSQFYGYKREMANDINPFFRWARSAVPQENLAIPMSHSVVGLCEYFYSFTQVEMPIYTEYDESKCSNLRFGAGRSNYHLFEWDAPYRNGLYTLVICNEYDEIILITREFANLDQNRAQIVKPNIEDFGVRFDFDAGTMLKAYLVLTLPDSTVYVVDSLEFEY